MEEQKAIRETAPFWQSWRRKFRGLAQCDSCLSSCKLQFMQKRVLEQNYKVKLE